MLFRRRANCPTPAMPPNAAECFHNALKYIRGVTENRPLPEQLRNIDYCAELVKRDLQYGLFVKSADAPQQEVPDFRLAVLDELAKRRHQILQSMEQKDQGGTMRKKYRMTELPGTHLYSIQAERAFGTVKAEKSDGCIQKKENLSHDGNCWTDRDAEVTDDAQIGGTARICGQARICGNAQIQSDRDWLSICNAGGYGETLTAFRQQDGSIGVECAGFFGTLDEFAARPQFAGTESRRQKERQAMIEWIRIRLEAEDANRQVCQ